MGKTCAVIGVVLSLACGCRVSPVPGSCRTDTDCRNPTREGYDQTRSICHPTLHQCVARLDGGANDGATDASSGLPQGSPCGPDSGVCANGQCVDGVCCETSSCPACKRCAAGTGRCESNAPAGPARLGECGGDESCGAGKCDGTGRCWYKEEGAVCAQRCDSATAYIRLAVCV